MGYQSFAFLIFTAATVLLYYLLGTRCQKWVLLAANITFYAIAGVQYIPFLVTTLLISYFSARLIGRYNAQRDEKLKACSTPAEKKGVRAAFKKKTKRAMLFGLLTVLGILIVDKYTGFMVANLNNILSLFNVQPIEMFKFIVPLGISYYTFMSVSYILDVYWGHATAETNFVNYAVFLSYFPHITQGPIGRYNKFRIQLQGGVAFSSKNIVYGSQLMLLGLFKKLVIADRLGLLVSQVYSGYYKYSGMIFVVATVFYAIQIYCDFSGCMDIVSGVSEMLGITLDKNFNHPFFSKNIREFWRRWHITMGAWFKDYIFMPLNRSSFMSKMKKKFKEKKFNRAAELFDSCIPTLVIWFVTGLWHSPSWNYILWGVYFAVIMILGDIFKDFNAKLPGKLGLSTETFSWRLFQILRTFAVCCVGRVLPRAQDLPAALAIYRRTFQNLSFDLFFNGEILNYGLDGKNMTIVLVAIGILWIVDLLQEKMKVRDELAKQNLPFRWAVSIIAVLIILVFGMYGPGYDASAFIYGRF